MCPLVDDWIKKEKNVYTQHSGVPFDHKKEWILAFATTWMVLESLC